MLNAMSLNGMGMLFAMILGWTVVILGILWILHWLTGEDQSVKGTPLELLQHRYARGEMNRREYLERRADLLNEHTVSSTVNTAKKRSSKTVKPESE